MTMFTKPVACLDVESTGVDPVLNRIITLDITRFCVTPLAGEPAKPLKRRWQFNGGGQRMEQETIDVHGITNEMAATWPEFNQNHGYDILSFIRGCDILGYNCLGFDLTIINEELVRVGLELDMTGRLVFDPMIIFRKMEKRDLTAAVKFYCGRERQGAHDSGADVAETIAVFLAQLEHYPEFGLYDAKDFDEFCRENKVDINGTIARNKDGVPCFNTKRNRGVPVTSDPGYADWMLRQDGFPSETKRVIRSILAGPQAPSPKQDGEDDVPF